MTTFVALIRGINVSGKKPLRMADLQTCCEALNFQNVRTYLQSGNIVFEQKKVSVRALAKTLTTAIAKRFGHNVESVVLTEDELDRVVSTNPLKPPTSGDAQTLFHATFLLDAVPASRFTRLELPIRKGEKAVLVGRTILLYCPHGYGTTKLNNGYFEKNLGVTATTRNWRTVLALRELCRTRPHLGKPSP